MTLADGLHPWSVCLMDLLLNIFSLRKKWNVCWSMRCDVKVVLLTCLSYSLIWNAWYTRDVTGAISPFNKSSDVGIIHKEESKREKFEDVCPFMLSSYDVCLDNAYLYTGRSYWVYERMLYLSAMFLPPACHLPFIIYFIKPAAAVFACTECKGKTVWLESPYLCLFLTSIAVLILLTPRQLPRCLLPLQALCTIHLNLPPP